MTRQIRLLGIGLMVCFAVLFVQLNRLTVFQADKLNNNPNNTREILRDFSQPRGTVTTADGVVVARVGRRRTTASSCSASIPRARSSRRSPATTASRWAARAWRRPTTTSWPVAPSTCRSRTSATSSSTRTAVGDLSLTVRADLQRIAAEQLGDREGSVVALDPRTGAILAMVSFPTYDPNILANHDTQAAADAATLLDASPDKPRLSRAYQDRFFPGSTFKVVTATAGLTSGAVTVDDPTYPVSDQYRPGHHPPAAELRRLVLRRHAVRGAPRLVQHRVRADGRGDRARGDGRHRRAVRVQQGRADRPHAARPSRTSPPTSSATSRPWPSPRSARTRCRATPLQMAMVAGAVANEGRVMVPHVLRGRARRRRQHRRHLRRRRSGRPPWTAARRPCSARP